MVTRKLVQLVCLVVLTLIANVAFAVTNNISCSYTAITNALALAKDGDVILIGPGTCTISNEIDISRNVSFTISGSGTNTTELIESTPKMFWIHNDSSKVFTFCNFNVVESTNASYCLQFGDFSYDSAGPYHVYNIEITNVNGRAISMGYGKSHSSIGLIDHCYMVSQAGSNPQFVDFEGSRYGSWTNAIPFGTTNASYVEDCYFDNKANLLGNGYFDGYTGAQFVFRHNFCYGYAPSGCHGYDSGDISPRSWEIYNNIFTNYYYGTRCLQIRGGAGEVFSNQFYGAGYNAFCALDYYRSCMSANSYIATDGQPGVGLDINFSGTPMNYGPSVNGNPTNGWQIKVGFTYYEFFNYYTNNPINVGVGGGYGGGYVLIGATVAETETNFLNCVTLGSGAGTTYSANAIIGHDFCRGVVVGNDVILINVLDGNTDQYGYPGNQQEGVIQSFPLVGTNFVNHQTLWPCYAWSNSVNGVDTGYTMDFDTEACGYYITNLLKLGRDYFNYIIPTNYTPLVYPHPLQALETVAAIPLPTPTGLQVVPNN